MPSAQGFGFILNIIRIQLFTLKLFQHTIIDSSFIIKFFLKKKKTLYIDREIQLWRKPTLRPKH